MQLAISPGWQTIKPIRNRLKTTNHFATNDRRKFLTEDGECRCWNQTAATLNRGKKKMCHTLSKAVQRFRGVTTRYNKNS